MKPIGDMTRLEIAGFVASELRRLRIDVVLSGGSCVSIYSHEKYVSFDLDFVNMSFTKRIKIVRAMESLGFQEEHRYFKHPETEILIEFPSAPLGVGEEPVKQIDEIDTGTGMLRIISPTDCVKDRLTWYYYENDTECLAQAVLVAKNCDIDLDEIQRWSEGEGKGKDFQQIRVRLEG